MYNITSDSDHLKHHMLWNGGFGFHQYRYILWFFCEFLIWSWKKFSYLRKSKACSVEGDARVCSKVCSAIFRLVFHGGVQKMSPFLILYEKYRMSSYTTYLIRNVDTPIFRVIDLNDLLGSLSIMAWISVYYFLARTTRRRHPRCRIFVITSRLIQLFSKSLHCP